MLVPAFRPGGVKVVLVGLSGSNLLPTSWVPLEGGMGWIYPTQ